MSARVDPYSTIHKCMRAMMAEATLALGRADLTNVDETRPAVLRMVEVLGLMLEHAHVEEASFHPALATRAPEVVAALEGDHRTIDPKLEALAERGRAYDAAPAPSSGYSLYLDFAAVSAEYTAHLDREERVATPAFHAHFTDAELLEMQGRMRAALGPEKVARWAAHMFPAISHAERLGMLTGIKATAPAPAFQAMLSLADRVLTPTDRDRLRAALA